MRFIHIADLHLGSSPEAEFLWGKNRAEEIWDSFAAVIDACNEKEIDLLLIAGDLFDRPPVWADLDRAAKLFARLTATEVVMIAGASDYITEDSPWKTYPWQSWVHMLSDKHCMNVQLGNINTSVHGCSYYAPTEGKPYLEDARPDKESEYHPYAHLKVPTDCSLALCRPLHLPHCQAQEDVLCHMALLADNVLQD